MSEADTGGARAGGLRLLVVVNHFDPDRGGGGAVYTDMCQGLAARGIEVTAWCPYPFYPEWTDKSGRNGWRLWRYVERGVNVVRYGFFLPSNPRSFAQRMLFELSLALSLTRLVPAARRFDAIMVYCPYFGSVVAVGLMKMLFGKPVWLNVQDISSDAAAGTGMVRGGALKGLLAGVESFFFNRADVWSSLSPVMIERLEQLRRRDQPILFLPNWVDDALSRALAANERPDRAPGTPPRLLYAGNIGGKQDLLAFLMTLHESAADFRFAIFGNGGEAGKVRDWVAATGDPRFSFGPFLDAGRLAEELTAADFYVITERSGTGASFFPSKYVTGIAAGTPILAVCDAAGPLGREMESAATGPCLDWSAASQVPALLADIARAPERWHGWRRRAQRRAADFDRNAILDRLVVNLERFAAREHQRTVRSLGEIAGSAR